MSRILPAYELYFIPLKIYLKGQMIFILINYVELIIL